MDRIPMHPAPLTVVLCCVLALPAQAKDLADMSLEELANIQVTSVSKKTERLADAAASVFVIRAEDIRRSGVNTLPEALRLAPNLHVARVSNGSYSISARGLNGSNNSAPNKLLVLINGRSVYTPLFSGVFWDAQDLMLEDVERIEVISGPGGTLWGTNAVNGVINVITRPAADTQGTLAVVGKGSDEGSASLRHGGRLGDQGHYRLYARYTDKPPSRTEDGAIVHDAMHAQRAGLRADLPLAAGQLSLNAAIYEGAQNQAAPGAIAIDGFGLELDRIDFKGSHLTASWARELDGGSRLLLQAYYDSSRRSVPPTFAERLDIVDLQLQHSLTLAQIHAVTWGLHHRHSWDRVDNKTAFFAFLPADVEQEWSSLFAQDEITLGEKLRLTLGARIERNDYTGNEFLPNVRLAWNMQSDQLLWMAASRAVRAPSRLDVDAYIPAEPPFLLDGGRQVRSEIADVYEIGYRAQPSPQLAYSFTVFHAEYDHMRTQEIAPSGTFLVFANGMEGQGSGVEAWGRYQLTPSWRLSAGFTALRESFRLKPGSNDAGGPASAGKDPSNTWQLRSAFDLSSRQELELALRHVARLPQSDVPAYTTLDLRWAWTLRPGLTLALNGSNLLGEHAEYGPRATRSVMQPGVFASLTWTP